MVLNIMPKLKCLKYSLKPFVNKISTHTHSPFKNSIRTNSILIIEYFDFNDQPIKRAVNIIKKEPIKENYYYPPTSYSGCAWTGGSDNNGNIIHQPIDLEPKQVETKVESEFGKSVKRAAVGLTGAVDIILAATAASVAVPVLAHAIYIATGAVSYIFGKFTGGLFR